jgi:hypothetical protein
MGGDNIMTYHRGTWTEFNSWHEAAKLAEGIPPEGKIGFVNGVPAPDNQRTTEYSSAIAHPVNEDYYIWLFGAYPMQGKDVLSDEDVRAVGWFAEGT